MRVLRQARSESPADHSGFTSALIVAWGGIGGILASTLFMDSEAKIGYPTGESLAVSVRPQAEPQQRANVKSGVYSVVGLNAFQIVTVVGLRYFYVWQNKRADKGKTVIEGDPNFRYSL